MSVRQMINCSKVIKFRNVNIRQVGDFRCKGEMGRSSVLVGWTLSQFVF